MYLRFDVQFSRVLHVRSVPLLVHVGQVVSGPSSFQILPGLSIGEQFEKWVQARRTAVDPLVAVFRHEVDACQRRVHRFDAADQPVAVQLRLDNLTTLQLYHGPLREHLQVTGNERTRVHVDVMPNFAMAVAHDQHLQLAHTKPT